MSAELASLAAQCAEVDQLAVPALNSYPLSHPDRRHPRPSS
jgi:hypothetical protein